MEAPPASSPSTPLNTEEINPTSKSDDGGDSGVASSLKDSGADPGVSSAAPGFPGSGSVGEAAQAGADASGHVVAAAADTRADGAPTKIVTDPPGAVVEGR